MKPFIPLSFVKKATEKLPDFTSCKSNVWTQAITIHPKVELHWEKSEILKEWVLVEVIMEEDKRDFGVKPYSVDEPVDNRPSGSIYDLLELMENLDQPKP
jgi:hypothetical protein